MGLRKNVKNLTAAEKTAFVNAVVALKNQPSVLNPGQQGRYDDYVQVHLNAMLAGMAVPGWAHGVSAFFPWHRVLLLQFEKDLQAIDPTVTIPYWDWPDPASWPFTDDFLGGNGTGLSMGVQTSHFASTAPTPWTLVVLDNPDDPTFLQRQLGADPSATTLPTSANVDTAKSYTSYDRFPWRDGSPGFRSQAEYRLHNKVHRYVGGAMANMTSPNDPVFWLHHCNIDRLWGEWQLQHPTKAPYLPLNGATEGQNLDDNMIFSMDGSPAPWIGSSTPRSVINHHALGYSYDSELAEDFFASPPIRAMLSSARTNFPLMDEIETLSRDAMPVGMTQHSNGQRRFTPNHFELTGHQTEITYDVTAFDGRPHLTYRVVVPPPLLPPIREFVGDEICSQDSEIGTQVTVTLTVIPDKESTTLTLLVPIINLEGITEQAFETVAIVTTQRTSIGGPDFVNGQVQSYKILKLKGMATFVES